MTAYYGECVKCGDCNMCSEAGEAGGRERQSGEESSELHDRQRIKNVSLEKHKSIHRA